MDIKEILKNHNSPLVDTASEKDYLLAHLLPEMKSFDNKEKILNEVTAVSNQASLSTCTSNATCDGFEHVIDDKIDLSRLFVYWNSRTNKTQATGTSIRSALDSIRVHGVPPEYAWPYDPEKVNVKPSDESYQLASSKKKTTYYRVRTCEEIIAAINAGWPVVFSILLDEVFVTSRPAADYVFIGNKLSEYSHAMLIVGYRQVNKCYQFRIRNSWGSAWGDNGYCWFDGDYISRSMSDGWAITNYDPQESITSRRNVEFAISSLISAGLTCFFLYVSNSITIDKLIAGLLMTAGLQLFASWRRWWINITINDKIKLF